MPNALPGEDDSGGGVKHYGYESGNFMPNEFFTGNRPDFTKPDYLGCGTPVQRKCAAVLAETGIMKLLSPFGPVVAGTIPIGIDIPGSDIDILCRTGEGGGTGFSRLERLLADRFGTSEGFLCDHTEQRGRPALVCSFRAGGMEIEVFAQDVPATRQNGYLHMITEYELLRIHGRPLRDKIMESKLAGIKTEPAFALALDLPGDPYEAILSKGRELGLF